MAIAPSQSGMSGNDDGYIPEDEEEETLGERLYGLTEMLPDPVRKRLGQTIDLTVTGVKKAYSWGRTGTWIFFSSSIIMVAPILFEVERFQMEEMQKMQQRQMLLGPNVARS